MPRVVDSPPSSDDEQDDAHVEREQAEIDAENARAYDEALEAGFDPEQVDRMRRAMEPLEYAVRNGLDRVDYTRDEGRETRDILYRWLGTLAKLRSGVENQTRWPASGFGELLKSAHSMRVTKLKDKHKQKGWLRKNMCKCQVCGTGEEECSYVIELCGDCEDEEHPYNAADWLSVEVNDLTRLWDRFYKSYARLFDKKLVDELRRSKGPKAMPKQYFGMFATGNTCLKRAMAAFNLQNLPMEICYRADMVAGEALENLRRDTKDQDAELDQEQLFCCDAEDATKVLTKIQSLERAAVAIDQGKAHLVEMQVEQMPELWSQIDEAKDIVLTSRVRERQQAGDELDALDEDGLERAEFQMCGRIADESLARIKGLDLEGGSESGGSSSAADRADQRGAGRAQKQRDQRAQPRQWGAAFADKQHRRQPDRPAPKVARGRNRSGTGGAKQRDIRSSLAAGAPAADSSDDEEFVPCDRDQEEEEESAESDEEEEEEEQPRRRSGRKRRHAALADSDEESEAEDEAAELQVEHSERSESDLREAVAASLQSAVADEMAREQRRRSSRLQTSAPQKPPPAKKPPPRKKPRKKRPRVLEEEEEEDDDDDEVREILDEEEALLQVALQESREMAEMAEERERGGPSGASVVVEEVEEVEVEPGMEALQDEEEDVDQRPAVLDPAARARSMRIPGPAGEPGMLPSRKRVIEDCYGHASRNARSDPALSMLLAHAAMTIQELEASNKRLRTGVDGAGRA